MAKILLILNNSFWLKAEKGVSGGDQMMIDLFSKVAQHYGEIYYIGSSKSIALMKAHGLNFTFRQTPVFIDGFPITVGYPLRTLYALWYVFFLKTKVDFIYSASDFLPDVVPAFFCKTVLVGAKWIQCVMHIIPHYAKRKGNNFSNILAYWAQQISFKVIKSADNVIVINNLVKTVLINEYYLNKSKILLITPCVDAARFRDIRKKRAAEGGSYECTYDCVYVGRFNEQKGVNDLPRIWKEVQRTRPSAKLAIIGSGNDNHVKKITELIVEFNLIDSITLFGFLDKNLCESILQKSKIFIFPSYEEGFGLVVLEAFLSGNAVIAWDLPHYAETFGGVITTISVGDILAMANEVIRAIDNPNLFTEKQNAIEAQLQRYDIAVMSRRLHELMWTD